MSFVSHRDHRALGVIIQTVQIRFLQFNPRPVIFHIKNLSATDKLRLTDSAGDLVKRLGVWM
jgi:hypothetical protein